MRAQRRVEGVDPREGVAVARAVCTWPRRIRWEGRGFGLNTSIGGGACREFVCKRTEATSPIGGTGRGPFRRAAALGLRAPESGVTAA